MQNKGETEVKQNRDRYETGMKKCETNARQKRNKGETEAKQV
jgi:hypothetical protein